MGEGAREVTGEGEKTCERGGERGKRDAWEAVKRRGARPN